MYFAVLGEDDDIAQLHRWATSPARGYGSGPFVFIERPDAPVGPGCPM